MENQIRATERHLPYVMTSAGASGEALGKYCPQLRIPGFLQVRENWKKSGNLSGQGKVSENVFLEKSGTMKNWCDQMSEAKIRFPLGRWGSLQRSPRLHSRT